MQTLLNEIREKPLQFAIGVCVFMVAVGGAAIKDVASTSLAVMFLISLFFVRHWFAYWQTLEKTEKLIFIGFVLYTLSALLSWVNAGDSDEFVKQFGRYLRFTLIIPVYLMIRGKNLDMSRYLVAGIVLSGFVYLAYSLYSVYQRPGMPATGYYHHITFGDAVMLNVGIMGLLLLKASRPAYRVFVGISLLCALYAALLSQARGAWIALPAYLVIYLVYRPARSKVGVAGLAAIAGAIVLLVIFTPAGNMIEKRYEEARLEIVEFTQGVNFATSVGGRLSMWNIAYDVWKEHPVTGTGLGDFDEDMMRYQAMGKYPEIEVHGSTHNIFIQAIVGTGVVGFVGLCYALVVAPMAHFIRVASRRDYAATSGVILVVSYAVFGLSESWILRAPAISIYIAYMIALASISQNDKMAASVSE